MNRKILRTRAMHSNEILNWILLRPERGNKTLREGARIFQMADKRMRIKHELIITCAPQWHKSFNWNFYIVHEKGTLAHSSRGTCGLFSKVFHLASVIDTFAAQTI